tara:strand:+ start:129 stop:638 length:510 start_codon:yes stop_codon:yes gene_type:complete
VLIYPKKFIVYKLKPIFINLSYLLLSCLLVSCYKKEETLYRWGSFSSWEWKTIGDKNKNPQYKGEVKRKYFIFGDYILEGSGTLNVPNGEKYVGEFKDGKYNGQGIVTIPDGSKYAGEWKNGNFNGQGTYTFSNGGSFVGFWKDSAPWNISGYNEKGEFVNYVEGKKIK